MKNIAVINAVALSELAGREILGGNSSVQITSRFGRSLPGVERIVALATPESGEKLTGLVDGVETRDAWTPLMLFERTAEISRGYDHVFYFYADVPLIDRDLSQKMIGNHVEYFADYTYADGFPYGLTPEIVRQPALAPLIELADDTGTVERNTLFETLRKDINSFDVETEISEVDQRMLRVGLCADTQRNFLLLQRLVEGGAEDAPSVVRALDDRPEILRTLPAYYNVQIVEGCPQTCSYCPYGATLAGPGKTGEMELERITDLLGRIVDFSGDATVSVSLWGEPSYHSRILDVIRLVCDRPGLDMVIETSGIGWDAAQLRELAANMSNPPTWIVSLDGWSEAVYRDLRGDGHQEARQTAELLLELFGENTYLQAVRMTRNELDIEEFYRGWKDRANTIIQKYDAFCGRLEDLQITDLSPLKRFPCWHAKRDVCVLLDGDVPLCREDLDRTMVLGNVFRDALPEIWRAGTDAYLAHVRGEYPRLCRSCDEYYTFNY